MPCGPSKYTLDTHLPETVVDGPNVHHQSMLSQCHRLDVHFLVLGVITLFPLLFLGSVEVRELLRHVCTQDTKVTRNSRCDARLNTLLWKHGWRRKLHVMRTYSVS